MMQTPQHTSALQTLQLISPISNPNDFIHHQQRETSALNHSNTLPREAEHNLILETSNCLNQDAEHPQGSEFGYQKEEDAEDFVDETEEKIVNVTTNSHHN